MKGKFFFIGLMGFVLLFSINVYGHFSYNEGDAAFCTDCVSKMQELDQPDISQLIRDGGEYFLKSGSHFNACLGILEGGKNVEKALDEIREAIALLREAKGRYETLSAVAKNTLYADSAIAQLVMFDYDSFQTDGMLVPSFFSLVRNYLAKGDVRGLFDHNVEITADVSMLFEMVERDLSAGVFDISNVWSANQSYMKAKFIGQYAAMVFSEIK